METSEAGGQVVQTKDYLVMGRRAGFKRADRRWIDDDGTVWASKFEYTVYAALKESGATVRKCTASDTVDYTEHKRNVRCVECGSCECVQDRTYTADLFFTPASAFDTAAASDGSSGGYYIETKGYFAPDKRRLFRSLRETRPDIDLRVILETDGWATKGKTRMTQYFAKYLKTTPVHVWNGDIPEDWK